MSLIQSTFLSLIITGLLCFSSSLFANHHEGGSHPSPLTEEQRATFKELKHAMHAGKEGRKEMHKQTHDLIFSDDYSQDELEKMIKEQQEKQRSNMVKNATAMNEFYKSLNEEQRKAVLRRCEAENKNLLEKKKQCKGKQKQSLIEE